MSSSLEITFAENWVSRYPDIDLHSEYPFSPPRKFRFDFAHPEAKIAIELQGGLWTNGRHNRGSGLLSEHEKLNLAASHGWRVFFLNSETVNELGIYDVIAQTIKIP
jgi:very-short-patch-repair endonuclease